MKKTIRNWSLDDSTESSVGLSEWRFGVEDGSELEVCGGQAMRESMV